ncbi:MAG: hypothetical protein JOY51_07660 [Nevskia sp.]|nr:hypothetical protein [Nevskia sp.]
MNINEARQKDLMAAERRYLDFWSGAGPADTEEAWRRAEHEAELLRVARYRAMPLRDRLRALENRGRLLARLKQQREARRMNPSKIPQ